MSGRRREEDKDGFLIFYLIAFLVTVLDQITKYFALAALVEGQSIPIIPGVFHLTLVFNTGIAFGLFQEHRFLLLTLISVSIVLLIVFSKSLSEGRTPLKVSLALILGGAIGNWIDRLHHKAVVDFLDFRVWPVFNVADSAITVGVLLYLIFFLFADRRPQGKNPGNYK